MVRPRLADARITVSILMCTLVIIGTGPFVHAEKVSFYGHALGTDLILHVEGLSNEKAQQAFAAVSLLADRLEPQLTTYTHPGWARGDILRVNAAAGRQPVPIGKAAMAVLRLGKHIARQSGGVVDITLGPLSGVWSLQEGMRRVPSQAAIEKAKRLVDWRKLQLDATHQTAHLERSDMSLDVAGIAKGYVVEAMAELLEQMDVARFVIQAGGDMALRTGPTGRPFTVGVRDPRGLLVDDLLGALLVTGGAVSTAGDYERGFADATRRYHHVLDPRTGMPSDKAQAAIVYHKSALLADAYDEVLMILGVKQGLSWLRGRADGLIVDNRGEVFLSNGLFLASSTHL